ncbi:MAG: type II secretion system protein N [Gammaproteobacteria bacterium]
MTCREISGTAWDGSCSGLVYQGAPVGNLHWKLHPGALLSGKVAAFVDLTRGSDFVRGEVEAASGGKYSARNLQARLPLDPPPVPDLSTGFSGNANVNLANVQVEKNLIIALEGTGRGDLAVFDAGSHGYRRLLGDVPQGGPGRR